MNYIEIQHVSTEDDEETHEEESTVWYAVRPTPDHYREWKHGEDAPEWKSYSFSNSWNISGGEPVRIYTQSDIDGLRELLDVIEANLS